MIPRLHKRGTSFKGACRYILHDAGQKSSADRVDWTISRNLGSPHIEDAWFELSDTWRDRARLKEAAGVDARGRDNKKPVLHYTLSWHAADNPTPEHMQKVALDSLRILGLSEHQAVIAAHRDKDHLHVHIVANTVHPLTGKTASLKFTKRDLSLWAERYEREQGMIHCDERVKNNEQRRQIGEHRRSEGMSMLVAASQGYKPGRRAPYVPVKDKSLNRKEWFTRREVSERVWALKEPLYRQQVADRGVTWQRHKQERAEVHRNTLAALDNARSHIKGQMRPQWRELYAMQKRELRHVIRTCTHPLERAVFVFGNRTRLGNGSPLSLRKMVTLIRNPHRLIDHVQTMHTRERTIIAQIQKARTHTLTDVIWTRNREKLDAMTKRQMAERTTQRLEQKEVRRNAVTRVEALQDLKREQQSMPPPEPVAPREVRRDGPPPPTLAPKFNKATERPPLPRSLTRAEEIKLQMEEWRKKNPERDFGREL